MMMHIAIRSTCVALALSMGAGHTVAQRGWIGVLKNTAAENFDDEDLRLFMDASRKALNGPPEQGAVAWENAATKSRGNVTVEKTFTWHDHPCRRLRVDNEAHGVRDSQTASLCQVDLRWRLVSPSDLQE